MNIAPTTTNISPKYSRRTHQLILPRKVPVFRGWPCPSGFFRSQTSCPRPGWQLPQVATRWLVLIIESGSEDWRTGDNRGNWRNWRQPWSRFAPPTRDSFPGRFSRGRTADCISVKIHRGVTAAANVGNFQRRAVLQSLDFVFRMTVGAGGRVADAGGHGLAMNAGADVACLLRVAFAAGLCLADKMKR